ncbi:hypothetical protein [Streptomyces sp. R41]|uniref:Uncharacterized protein n=1 Tax=Streptomyces sp. R41 TaxID=3238632 RepID=A0AB39RUP0_9ACTN
MGSKKLVITSDLAEDVILDNDHYDYIGVDPPVDDDIHRGR